MLQEGHGELVVLRRPHESSDHHQPWKFLPCEFCLGFVYRWYLSKHAQQCPANNTNGSGAVNYVRNAKAMIAPLFCREGNADREVNSLIDQMKETGRNSGVKALCMNDMLIHEFAQSLLDKLGTEAEQRRKNKDNIRTKLRTVGRLLKHLNTGKLQHEELSNFINGRRFMTVVEAVKECSLQAESPSIALTLGHYLKQIFLLKLSLGIRTENATMKAEATDFKQLFEAHWTAKVSSVANHRMKLRAINKPVITPATSDLITLKSFLEQEVQAATQNVNPSYEEWRVTAQMVMVRVVLFNKRRISEVEELRLLDFHSRSESSENQEIVDSLDATEQALVKR